MLKMTKELLLNQFYLLWTIARNKLPYKKESFQTQEGFDSKNWRLVSKNAEHKTVLIQYNTQLQNSYQSNFKKIITNISQESKKGERNQLRSIHKKKNLKLALQCFGSIAQEHHTSSYVSTDEEGRDKNWAIR